MANKIHTLISAHTDPYATVRVDFFDGRGREGAEDYDGPVMVRVVSNWEGPRTTRMLLVEDARADYALLRSQGYRPPA